MRVRPTPRRLIYFDADNSQVWAFDASDGTALWHEPLVPTAETIFSGAIDGGVVIETDRQATQTFTAYRS